MQFDLEEMGKPCLYKMQTSTVSFGHGISTTPLQVATAYEYSNGGYKIKPTLIKQEIKFKTRYLIMMFQNINSILRKIVSTKEGTASLANVGDMVLVVKLERRKKIENGSYTKKNKRLYQSFLQMNQNMYY